MIIISTTKCYWITHSLSCNDGKRLVSEDEDEDAGQSEDKQFLESVLRSTLTRYISRVTTDLRDDALFKVV